MLKGLVIFSNNPQLPGINRACYIISSASTSLALTAILLKETNLFSNSARLAAYHVVYKRAAR
jgi:hypothetical protein